VRAEDADGATVLDVIGPLLIAEQVVGVGKKWRAPGTAMYTLP